MPYDDDADADTKDAIITTDWMDTSSNYIRNVMEPFAESFCPGGTTEDHPCGSFERCVSPAKSDRSLQYNQMEWTFSQV